MYSRGTRRLLKTALVLVVSIQTNCTLGGLPLSEAHAGGRRLMIAIADFQAGFSRMECTGWSVRHRTTQRLQESVAMLQDAHRGAGSNNNVTYTHRP